MRYHVEHTTRYEYGAPVATSQHVAHLTPRTLARQRARDHVLAIDPEPASRSVREDYFGNIVDHFTILQSHRILRVSSTCSVDVLAESSVAQSMEWERVRDAFAYTKNAAMDEAVEYVFSSPYVTLDLSVREYAAASFSPERSLLDVAKDLRQRIHREFRFDPSATTVATPVARVIEQRRGVCQDLAHVMIAAMRAFGLPARYVSGYLLTEPPDGSPRLLGVDASHAWVSVYCPAAGWVDLDPTNDVMADERYIVLGWGRDYGDVCPLRGVFVGGGASQQLHVGVSVVAVES